MKPILKHIDPMSVVGISVRTTNHVESKTGMAKLPVLWGRFFQENISGKIPNQIQSPRTYGVYSSYESNCDKKYTVTAGKCVSSVDNLPQDLVIVNIEGGNYLVFEGKGPMPEIVIKAWKDIWNYFSSKFVDFHLIFPKKLIIESAHTIATAVEAKIAAELENASVMAHIEPCKNQECPKCRRL